MTEWAPSFVLHLLESTVWSIGLVGAVALARVPSARARCLLYRVCLIKFVIPSGVLLGWVGLGQEVQDLAIVSVVAQPVQSLTQSTGHWSFASGLVAVWLAGAVGMLGVRVVSLGRFGARLNRVGEPFAGRFSQALEDALSTEGRDRNYVGGFVETGGPLIGLYGVFRPRIIARRAFLEALDEGELRLALRHEIAHKARRDNLWNLGAEAIACAFWFHPLVWFLKNRIRQEMEKACDEHVLSGGGQSKAYATCLIKAGEFALRQRFPGALAFSGHSLKRRVQHVNQYQDMRLTKIRLLNIGAVALSFVIASLAMAAVTDTALVGEVFSISELDEKPSYIEFAKPVYPKELHEQGVSGTVVVEFVLTADAEVRSAKVLKEAEGYPEFGVSAVEAVKQSTWKAGKKDGKPVATRVRMPIQFTP